MNHRSSARTALAGIVAMAGLAFAAPASAHVPSATMGCLGETDPQPILQVDLTQYNGTNHVLITIDGATVRDEDFGASFSATIDAGSPFVAHAAQVVVTAHDDPEGTHGWTKTYDLGAPACQEKPPSGRLSLAFNGPCGDPLYRVTFRNTTGHAAQGTFHWKRGKDGVWRTLRVTVQAHSTVRTPYRWVKGRSLMTATLGAKRIQERSAPGGWYGTCPR